MGNENHTPEKKDMQEAKFPTEADAAQKPYFKLLELLNRILDRKALFLKIAKNEFEQDIATTELREVQLALKLLDDTSEAQAQQNQRLAQQLEDARASHYRLAERCVSVSEMLLHVKKSGAINPSSKLWSDIESVVNKHRLDQIPSIHWRSVEKELPRINQHDKFDVENKISERVLCFHEQYGSAFGRYYHISGHWRVEGFMSTRGTLVNYFAYLDSPQEYNQ